MDCWWKCKSETVKVFRLHPRSYTRTTKQNLWTNNESSNIYFSFDNSCMFFSTTYWIQTPCTLPCMYELIIRKICEMIVVLKPFTVTNYSLSHNKNEKKLSCSKKSSFVGYLVIFILPLCFLFSYIDVFWKI